MRLRLFATAIAMLATSLVARADMTGDTIHGTYNFPTLGNIFQDLGNFTVPGGGTINGVEYSISGNQVTLTDVSLTASESGTFNGFQFTDITQDPQITGVTLDPSSTFSGAVATFTSDSLAFNFTGLNVSPGDTAVYDITFASTTNPTPEPSGLILLGTGLLGLAGTLRRRFV